MVAETSFRTKWPRALAWSKVMSHWVQTWPRRTLNMGIIKSPTLLETHNTISCSLHQHDHLWKQPNKETSLSILWTRINIKHVFLYNFLTFTSTCYNCQSLHGESWKPSPNFLHRNCPKPLVQICRQQLDQDSKKRMGSVLNPPQWHRWLHQIYQGSHKKCILAFLDCAVKIESDRNLRIEV